MSIRAIEQTIIDIISDQLGVNPDEVHPEVHLSDDLNADDLDLGEIMESVEKAFDLSIEDRESLLTVGQLIHYVERNAR